MGAMATYKILYWQEVPSQIRAEDELDEVSLPLPGRFQEEIDRLASKRGLQGADDYLSQWRWSEEETREGSAREVAEAMVEELERTWADVR
jgi:Virulence factor